CLQGAVVAAGFEVCQELPWPHEPAAANHIDLDFPWFFDLVLAIAPASQLLSVGSDSNGSGAVALLEIARLFFILYSNPNTRGSYNLLFGLTSGGPYNYNGTQESVDQRLRESIDYAICLNSVGSWDNELWIHVSKPPENTYIKQIFESFSNVAKELGVKVGLKHKKINISNPRVAWEHEQFSKLRVTAATISKLSAAPELNFVNETSIIKSVKLIVESLARHIYGFQEKNIQIFADNSCLAVNSFYVKSWLELLSRTPRVAPFLPKNDPFILALKKELEDHTHEVNMQHEVFDGMFTFYDSSKAKLNIYQGLDNLISLFRRPPSRKFLAMPWLVHDTNDDLSSSRVRKMLHENYLYREFGNVDAAGDPIPTSAVLMASSKQIAFKCQAENVAFLKCKKNDPNTEKCLDKGQQVTRCVLGLKFRSLRKQRKYGR
ncbi:hypothetical protein G4B88_002066, partial [Cannabis sativa]